MEHYSQIHTLAPVDCKGRTPFSRFYPSQVFLKIYIYFSNKKHNDDFRFNYYKVLEEEESLAGVSNGKFFVAVF